MGAEVRSLYFGDFANRYSRRKQVITFVTFFLSSGAAATLVGKSPSWVPLVLSILGALLTAYSLAFGLERLVRTMARLHYSWNQIATDYDRLWNHAYDDDAENVFGGPIKARTGLVGTRHHRGSKRPEDIGRVAGSRASTVSPEERMSEPDFLKGSWPPLPKPIPPPPRPPPPPPQPIKK